VLTIILAKSKAALARRFTVTTAEGLERAR